MRLPAVGLAFLVAASGCLAPAGTDGASDLPGGLAFAADCTRPGVLLEAGGVCAWPFAPGPGSHLEASLATHPTDADTLLLTWTEREPGRAKVWSASTGDGGATWTTTHMHDPAIDGPAAGTPYAFDSVARFARDGTAVVFFGGELSTTRHDAGPARVGAAYADRMTVARSADGGASWTYHAVHADPAERTLLAADFMDLALAPDGDEAVVVAQTSVQTPGFAVVMTPAGPLGAGPAEDAGTYVWTSADGGRTWSAGRPLDDLPRKQIVPRVGMGPGGLVVVATASITEVSRAGPLTFHGLALSVSRDAGRTFEPPVHVTSGDDEVWLGLGSPVFGVGADGAVRVDVVLVEGRDVLVVSSEDGARTWSQPRRLATGPDGTEHWFAVGTRGGDGTLHVLAQATNACIAEPDAPRLWQMQVHHEAADGRTGSTDLTDVLDVSPTGCQASNEYGGVGVAADGALWTAWSDAREAEAPRIVVARLVPS